MRYLLALLLAVAALAAQAQQLYRWTDKDGKVQYGQNPPAGVAAKALKGTTSTVAPQTPAPTSQSSTSGQSSEGKPRFDRSKQY